MIPDIYACFGPPWFVFWPQASKAVPVSESGTVDPSEGALESDFQKRMDESWVSEKTKEKKRIR